MNIIFLFVLLSLTLWTFIICYVMTEYGLDDSVHVYLWVFFSSVTVVVHYSKFWVKLPGPIIYQHGVPPLPPQSDSTPPPVHTSTASILPGPVSVTSFGLLIVTLILHWKGSNQ